jgi:hypothetical protein
LKAPVTGIGVRQGASVSARAFDKARNFDARAQIDALALEEQWERQGWIGDRFNMISKTRN